MMSKYINYSETMTALTAIQYDEATIDYTVTPICIL